MFDAGDLGMTEGQCNGCGKMNEQFQEKPWRFWVKEVRESWHLCQQTSLIVG